jgi:hypothetical protein
VAHDGKLTHHRNAVCVAAFVLAVSSVPAAAQRVSGRVTGQETGAPLAGAIVSAFSGRDTAAVTLTRSDGRFFITLPARRQLTLLVRAIGMRPFQIPLAISADTVVNVQMTRIAFTLRAIRVNEFTQCSRAETGTADIVDVWMEVTKALENTRLVRDSEERRFHYRLYELQRDFRSGRTRVLRNDSSSWVATRPFKVTPPRELARNGYVVVDNASSRNLTQALTRSPGALLYRAPDEMVLLDDSFQNTHCFWASHGTGENRDLIGVWFIPITGIRINDIRGVFWIDANTYELRRLDYLYTQVDMRPPEVVAADSTAPASTGLLPSLSNPEPGGVIEFQRIADGSFIIPNWRIYVNDTWTASTTSGRPPRAPTIGKETGGLVLRIQPR